MKYCHNCGTQLADNAAFCTNCGTVQIKLNRAQQEVKFGNAESAAETETPAPAEAAEAVEAPKAAPEYNPGFSGTFSAPSGYERPKPASALEYGKPPTFDAGRSPWSEGAKPSKREVKMPELGGAGRTWQPGGSFEPVETPDEAEAVSETPSQVFPPQQPNAFGQPNSAFEKPGAPSFQGRPVNGDAAASGRVPAGTEGSFSAGYGRGTTHSFNQSQTGQPVQPGLGGQYPPAQQAGQGKKGGRGLIIALVVFIVIAVIAIAAIAIGLVMGVGGSGAQPVETGSSDHVIYEDCEVLIGDGYLFKDFAGDDAIAVEVTWTNLGDRSDFAADSIEVRAFQDGEELLITMPSDVDDLYPQTDLYYSDVAPGESVTFVACFELDSSSEPVDVEVTLYSGSRVKATCSYTLN